jgi:hypothetical protein
MVRRKELEQILPALGQMGVHTLLVTSAVIPIPKHWMTIPRLRVAVSIDGLPEHHNVRRKPATYERIIRNIQGCTVNIHWTITRAMLCRSGYLEEYLRFWSSRAEVNRIWASIYSPQVGERTTEMLGRDERQTLAKQMPHLKERYPKFLMNEGIARAFLKPPQTPHQCLFSKMSTNYSADLKTRVDPCVLGGAPDCAQCGCAASVGLHWVKSVRLAGRLKIDHVIRASMAIGRVAARLRREEIAPARWQPQANQSGSHPKLVQITGVEFDKCWKERSA